MKSVVAITLGLVLFATPVLAYIGPVAGITMLGALWGVIAAVVLALAAVLLWPLRMLLRRRRKGAAPAKASAAVDTEADAPSSAP